jgi:hypothetical protein
MGYIIKRGVDDQFVVSYNYSMIEDFKVHINVIVAQDLAVVSYIYKYIYKGEDQTKIFNKFEKDSTTVDEIQDYVLGRCLTSTEAAWRIFNFDTVVREPSCTVLKIHLEREDLLVINDQFVQSSDPSKHVSDLIRYFCRLEGEKYDNLTFLQYFSKYSVTSKNQQKNVSDFQIRINYI